MTMTSFAGASRFTLSCAWVQMRAANFGWALGVERGFWRGLCNISVNMRWILSRLVNLWFRLIRLDTNDQVASRFEEVIEAEIAEHRARNIELRRVLISEGIQLTEKRPFDVHFVADQQHDAALLARELFRKRLLVKLLSRFEDTERWTVEAIAEVPPEEILGDRLTEHFVRLAAKCRAVYNGWGTAVALAVRRDDTPEAGADA